MDILFILLGLALLYAGAEGLVKGSSAIALKLGLSPLVVGLTVVAYGTSMPELIVSVKSALAGQSGIAVGNVVGSNIFNIGVILGVASIICPIKVNFQLVKIDVPIMIGITLLAMFFFLDGALARWEAGVLFAGILLYTCGSIIYAKKTTTAEVHAEFEEAIAKEVKPLWLDLLFIAGGLGLLVFGSRFLVDGSVSIARTFGISEAIIGLTIVAAGTSTPELAASMVAAMKKEPDIAIGNIVGSNIYNILCILGAAGLIAPISAGGVAWTDMFVMLGMSILLIPILWSGFVIKRWEGVVLLMLYGGYLAWLWPK
jgi:cation:H+ antiporter